MPSFVMINTECLSRVSLPALGLLCRLLELVRHEAGTVRDSRNRRWDLKRGDVGRSKEELATIFGINRETLDSFLSELADNGLVRVQSTRGKGSIISFVDFERITCSREFRSVECRNNRQSDGISPAIDHLAADKPPTFGRQQAGHILDGKKKDLQKREGEDAPRPAPSLPPDSKKTWNAKESDPDPAPGEATEPAPLPPFEREAQRGDELAPLGPPAEPSDFPSEAWKAALDAIGAAKPGLLIWFDKATAGRFDGASLVISAPDIFFRKQLQRHADMISEAFGAAIGSPLRVSFTGPDIPQEVYLGTAEPTPLELQEAGRLARLIEAAPGEVCDPGGKARVVSIARMLRDAGKGSVLKLSRADCIATIEGIVGKAHQEPEIATILADLQRYPDGCYPDTAAGMKRPPSRVEKAWRLLQGQVLAAC